MSSLTNLEIRKFERLFHRMAEGFVLSFTHRTFEAFFLDEFEVDISGQRYCAGCSTANQLRAFWRVEDDHLVGHVLNRLLDEYRQDRDLPEQAERLLQECRAIARRLVAGKANVATLKTVAKAFDSAYLANQLRRMEEAIEQDPELAIGTAKETVETCCKTILADLGRSPSPGADISTLTKETLKELRLVPEAVSNATRGADVLKRLLSNLGTIGNALAELRGLYGTGHGRHEKTTGLRPRHARLAVGAAATLCTFLFETHQELQNASTRGK